MYAKTLSIQYLMNFCIHWLANFSAFLILFGHKIARKKKVSNIIEMKEQKKEYKESL
jgi:hypothetical protein